MTGPDQAGRAPASARHLGIALAFAAAGISGVAVWLNAYGVRQVPDAAVYTTLKNGVAAAVLIGLLMLRGGASEVVRVRRRQWLTLGIVGLVGGGIPFLLFFTGLAHATAPGAAFIQKTLFVWVALLAVPLLGERLGWVQVAAIAVLLAGQVLLTPPKLEGASWTSAETMIAAATLLWAVEVVIVKRFLSGLSASLLGAARLGIGCLFLVGWLAISGALPALLATSAQGWLFALLTGAVLAAYVGTWFGALRRAPAGLVASILVVGAVITTVLQALTNGVPVTANSLLGVAVLVMAAAVLSAVSLRRTRQPATAG